MGIQRHVIRLPLKLAASKRRGQSADRCDTLWKTILPSCIVTRRLRVIGERTRFADDIQRKMAECEALTRHNDALNLAVCVNFEVMDIVQGPLARVAGSYRAKDEDGSAKHVYGERPTDLLIRTDGDHRVSNFLTDLAYTELYFTDQCGGFSADLAKAVAEFSNRKRRFGGRS